LTIKTLTEQSGSPDERVIKVGRIKRASNAGWVLLIQRNEKTEEDAMVRLPWH